MDTHNIGGLTRFWPFWDGPGRRRWETADIAVLVHVYRGGTLVAKKVGLLQFKRLYPENNDVEEDDEIGFFHGMNLFIRRQGSQAVGALHRTFDFNDGCVYGATGKVSEESVRRAAKKLFD